MASYLGSANRLYVTRRSVFNTGADGMVSGVSDAQDQADLVAQGCVAIADSGVPYTGHKFAEYDLSTTVYRSGVAGAITAIAAGDVAAMTALGVVTNPTSGVYVGQPHKLYFTRLSTFRARADGHILGVSTAADIADLLAQGCVALASAATGAIRNVAIGSALPNQVVTIGSSKNRFKERIPYYIAADCDVIYVPWANTYISNTTPFEVAGPGDLTVEKVAVEYNGRFMPITYNGGQRGVTVTASTSSQVLGDGNDVSGLGLTKLLKGTVVYLRYLGTMPAGGGVAATAFGTEQQYRFATGNSADDDIDGTGALAAPAAPDAVNVPGPVGIFGRVYGTPVSIVVLGDSITDNTNDFPGYGSDGLSTTSPTGGGGWPSRLAYLIGAPLLKMTLGGHKADNYFSQHAWRDTWWQYGTTGIDELGVNDSLNASSVLGRKRTAWTAMKNNGIQRVISTTITPKSVNDLAASPWNVNTTLAGEVQSGGSGGLSTTPLDYGALNTAIKADIGNTYGLQEVLDIQQVMGDASNRQLWPIPSGQLSTTLAAAITAGSKTSISLSAPASPGQLLALGPGATGVQVVKVNGASTGSGPYTVPIVTQTLTVVSPGATVLETLSADGTHPGPKAHTIIAGGLQAQASGWTASA